MQRFTVDRKTWYRGQGTQESKLLREDGMMCCLGHVGLQCGLTADYMLNYTSPSTTICSLHPLWPINLLASDGNNSDICSLMMDINDAKDIREQERETKLQKLALEANFELEFIN